MHHCKRLCLETKNWLYIYIKHILVSLLSLAYSKSPVPTVAENVGEPSRALNSVRKQ